MDYPELIASNSTGTVKGEVMGIGTDWIPTGDYHGYLLVQLKPEHVEQLNRIEEKLDRLLSRED